MRRKQVDGPHEGIDAHTVPTVPDDGHVHVPKILTADPAILPWKVRLAIEHYVDMPGGDLTTSVDIAARHAGMAPNEFRAYFKQPAVQEIIQKKLDLLDEKLAERRAAARVLTEDFLDVNTVAILEDKEAPAAAKVRMIEVGYRRFGMLTDKVENTGKGGAPMAFQIIRLGQKKQADA